MSTRVSTIHLLTRSDLQKSETRTLVLMVSCYESRDMKSRA
jgi:hypothetical protein